jgi:hypothetical protein
MDMNAARKSAPWSIGACVRQLSTVPQGRITLILGEVDNAHAAGAEERLDR